MSVPRLVLAGLEPGPVMRLAAGALLHGLVGRAVTRPVLFGLEVDLWRLMYDGPGKAPRVIDPAMHTTAVAAELFEYWGDTVDAVLLVATPPVLDRWEGVEGSRPVELAARMDAPLVIAVDIRDKGATAAATIAGLRVLTRGVDIAGLVLVGGDQSVACQDLADILREEIKIPVLGKIPLQLAEQFIRHAAVAGGHLKTIGPKPPPNAGLRLCEEAADYLDMDAVWEAASQRGYLPVVQRRLFARERASWSREGGPSLAIAWGPPLQPLGLENIDLLQAAGVVLKPLNISRDRTLPEGVSGLFLGGQLDEAQLPAFTANAGLMAQIATAVDAGLPTMAFGGGALLLLRRLADSRGRSHDLIGAIPAEAELIEWYDHPRYTRVKATRHNPYDAGENLLYELFDLEYLVLEQDSFAYEVIDKDGGGKAEGFAVHRCLTTTFYPSFALASAMSARFVDTMRAAGVWK